MAQLNEPADVTQRVAATPKPNFLTPPTTEEEQPKFKRNFFHNWVDSSDWRPKDVAIDTLRLTFTSNVKPLAKFLILQLYYNSFYTSFEIC